MKYLSYINIYLSIFLHRLFIDFFLSTVKYGDKLNYTDLNEIIMLHRVTLSDKW